MEFSSCIWCCCDVHCARVCSDTRFCRSLYYCKGFIFFFAPGALESFLENEFIKDRLLSVTRVEVHSI